MTFEAQQKSVQDNGSYEDAKIFCLQKFEPNNGDSVIRLQLHNYTLDLDEKCVFEKVMIW